MSPQQRTCDNCAQYELLRLKRSYLYMLSPVFFLHKIALNFCRSLLYFITAFNKMTARNHTLTLPQVLQQQVPPTSESHACIAVPLSLILFTDNAIIRKISAPIFLCSSGIILKRSPNIVSPLRFMCAVRYKNDANRSEIRDTLS